ncbi:hypothetical protein MTP04_08930 [Lysinibacillus sp. PLM2]|nr:hypothetical protein MTP04_08930 [Lysinibacillus sp. PLM2]
MNDAIRGNVDKISEHDEDKTHPSIEGNVREKASRGQNSCENLGKCPRESISKTKLMREPREMSARKHLEDKTHSRTA